MALALALGACAQEPVPPATPPGLADVLGDDLPGAQGLTLEDQDRIDRTMARVCAARVQAPADCRRHAERSAERRRALRAEPEAGV